MYTRDQITASDVGRYAHVYPVYLTPYYNVKIIEDNGDIGFEYAGERLAFWSKDKIEFIELSRLNRVRMFFGLRAK